MKTLSALAILPGLAAAQVISCPSALPEGSVGLRDAPPGWVATAPNPVYLDGAGMLSGDPKLMQDLVPASSKRIRGGGTSAWKFGAGEEEWVYCAYGRMAVQLSKRMNDKTTSCEISERRPNKGTVASITATCR